MYNKSPWKHVFVHAQYTRAIYTTTIKCCTTASFENGRSGFGSFFFSKNLRTVQVRLLREDKLEKLPGQFEKNWKVFFFSWNFCRYVNSKWLLSRIGYTYYIII